MRNEHCNDCMTFCGMAQGAQFPCSKGIEQLHYDRALYEFIHG